jgi:UDPglucose 6-dehydrogenase
VDISVIGSGYVGLVTSGCLAGVGNTVYCVDIDMEKIERLKKGILPIYEPGLKPLIVDNHREGRLHFCTSFREVSDNVRLHLIAVGTPPDENGSADLQHVLAAARDIGRNIKDYCVIATKSTVPVGTAQQVKAAVQEELDSRGLDISFDVVSNPEFLKEGAAVEDFMRPDRIVIGCDSERARELMRKLYAPLTRSHERILFMPIRDAEMTKYVANAMLATKISFMNEMAGLAEKLGVDIENVRVGIGSDPRIGYSFIYSGCGYGGSCFPKDIKALISTAEKNGFELSLIKAVDQRNKEQKRILFKKITARFGRDLSGMQFGIWGLSFKPDTDDMREAPSVVLINSLVEAGARVRAYDPAAAETARRALSSRHFDNGLIEIVMHQYDAIRDVDALVLVTEWKPFRYPDFAIMKKAMKGPVIFDGRNIYDPAILKQEGFEYFGIGR